MIRKRKFYYEAFNGNNSLKACRFRSNFTYNIHVPESQEYACVRLRRRMDFK